MWCLRRIARISWKEKVRNEGILHTTTTRYKQTATPDNKAKETRILWDIDAKAIS